MDTETRIFRNLQRHLDALPGGFPEVDSGLDIVVLKHFFSLAEAHVATQLSMTPEPIQTICDRVQASGISPGRLKELIDGMLKKGTVLANEEGYPEVHYCNAGFSPGGIYNFQVDRLTPDLIRQYQQYIDESRGRKKKAGFSKKTIPLRAIPVEKSIPLPEKKNISSYDDVRKIIESIHGRIAVANCICRQAQDMLGTRCTTTDLRETCLIIGPDHAKRHVQMGIGRYVTKEEVSEILEKAEADGLVLQPENSLKPEAICCCCGDCCALLKQLKKHPRPAEIFASNYYVVFDSELCSGCGLCVDSCQMGARYLSDDVAMVHEDRCIGCGGCVVVCPTDSNKLIKKENEYLPVEDKAAYNNALLDRQKHETP